MTTPNHPPDVRAEVLHALALHDAADELIAVGCKRPVLFRCEICKSPVLTGLDDNAISCHSCGAGLSVPYVPIPDDTLEKVYVDLARLASDVRKLL